MVVVAQLVRASVCGTEGRGFEPHLPPKNKVFNFFEDFFCGICLRNKKAFQNFERLIIYCYKGLF